MLRTEDICNGAQEFTIAADCSLLLVIVSNLPVSFCLFGCFFPNK